MYKEGCEGMYWLIYMLRMPIVWCVVLCGVVYTQQQCGDVIVCIIVSCGELWSSKLSPNEYNIMQRIYREVQSWPGVVR